MLSSTAALLQRARAQGYAVGAFNIYNLEGATAVVAAAEEMRSPVILQILPSALQLGRRPLAAMSLSMAEEASVEVAVHLDHCSSAEMLTFALECGFSSVMADGSAMPYEENIQFTREITALATAKNRAVEAELGKLSGEEDGITVAEREAKMTDPDEAVDFVKKTGVSALAVCVGNIHGTYHQPPNLDFARLEAIAKQIGIPLVLHGTSGLPDEMITRAIDHGVCKFNVNTEVRSAYMQALGDRFANSAKVELVEIMQLGIAAMKEPVKEKIRLFKSANMTACSNR
ncbi:class II fructose-bisphosphate aldolase [Desulfopila aestuarii]|uniref:Tagatose 1,6-diphosphate aldolase GatY/KbaY n=1 Tax=Desulfopila aestuarii DSM 18488 TaxID=1121416 RepID=A0A1M7YE16_9BACT|nr:class II fructose-bisphosphate aldolase [Desulfopila aestuarii]SHO50877.1 tagatose 1,6-diphosphate aldolase GatY/KbaY [Desulfopila aestuarii DSM 18488]